MCISVSSPLEIVFCISDGNLSCPKALPLLGSMLTMGLEQGLSVSSVCATCAGATEVKDPKQNEGRRALLSSSFNRS